MTETPQRDLEALIRSATPLLTIETTEEHRVVETFRMMVARVLRPLYSWSITDGLRRLDLAAVDSPDPERVDVAPDATATLHAIKTSSEAGVYLLLDFAPYLRYAMTQRLLREICQRQDAVAHTLVLVSPKIELPDGLESLATHYSLPMPDAQALAQLVRDEVFSYSREHDGKPVNVDAEAARGIVRNLHGLNLESARRILRQAIYDDGVIGLHDVAKIMRAKFDLLNSDGLLSFEPDTTAFADVAGMARLKRWIAQRRGAFLGLKAAAGLDPPKGVLLLGVQGCGKSLAAKAIAGGMGVPLVRLDFGTLYNKYHGETERNLREALARAGQLAPCVLWIDEIEKAIATSDSDDGVSRRVLGYLLTWMEERRDAVFLTATANQVRDLPAELLRKGRFDETFFVDLPDAPARAEIFAIHLGARGLKTGDFDTVALADASDGFSGAEIEQAIVSAQYAASAERIAMQQQHVLAALRETRPLSVLMAEPVAALRAWAQGRTVSAN